MAKPLRGSLFVSNSSWSCAACLVLACCGTARAQESPAPAQPTAPAPAEAPAVAPKLAPPKPEPPKAEEAPAEPIEPGAEMELTMRDGRRIVGLLVSMGPDRIVLSISGIATPFLTDTIERSRALPSVETRYNELRAAIDDEDTEQLLQLAEWLRSRGRLELSLWEIDHVLALEPTNARAKELKTWVVEQQKVATARQEARAKGVPPPEEDSGFPLLKPDEINLIRVFEIDLKDPPRMLVPRETIRSFLDTYAGRTAEGKGTVPSTPEGREMFLRQRPVDLVGWLFALRARELYPQVQVLDNPPAMRLFRDDVNRTWLTNSCATTKCHGGEDAGRLWLYGRKSTSDASFYTNFLILDRFKTSTGLGLIDYAEPARSPLLEMGLPHDQAIFKHPEVDSPLRGKWRPVFRDRSDEKFLRAVAWIRAMYPQRAGYPINYQPPEPHTSSPISPQSPR